MLTSPFLSEEVRHALHAAYSKLLAELTDKYDAVPAHHFTRTPERVVAALQELMEGLPKDAGAVLDTSFAEEQYDQMIVVKDIKFTSLCAHHLLPFQGVAHFGYLPDKSVVGLSKIPRLIETLARRPQIQECLSRQIVDCFQDRVLPIGCGVVIDAHHSCVSLRGVRKEDARMQTVALRGVFRDADVKAEFLSLVGGAK